MLHSIPLNEANGQECRARMCAKEDVFLDPSVKENKTKEEHHNNAEKTTIQNRGKAESKKEKEHSDTVDENKSREYFENILESCISKKEEKEEDIIGDISNVDMLPLYANHFEKEKEGIDASITTTIDIITNAIFGMVINSDGK